MSTSPCGLLMVVVSSPSGAGKTTLCRRLLTEHPELTFFRFVYDAPRATGWRDGKDYHFVSDDTFTQMVEAGAFAEWNWVHGRRYGTGRLETVRQALAWATSRPRHRLSRGRASSRCLPTRRDLPLSCLRRSVLSRGCVDDRPTAKRHHNAAQQSAPRGRPVPDVPPFWC